MRQPAQVACLANSNRRCACEQRRGFVGIAFAACRDGGNPGDVSSKQMHMLVGNYRLPLLYAYDRVSDGFTSR